MDSWLSGTWQYCKKLNRYNIKNSIKPSDTEGVFFELFKIYGNEGPYFWESLLL